MRAYALGTEGDVPVCFCEGSLGTVDDGYGRWGAGEDFIGGDADKGTVARMESSVGDIQVAFVGVVHCRWGGRLVDVEPCSLVQEWI